MTDDTVGRDAPRLPQRGETRPAPQTAPAARPRSDRAASCSSDCRELLEQRPAGRGGGCGRRIRSRTSAKTGSCASSSRPIANHCGPWPLNTNATRGADAERWPATHERRIVAAQVLGDARAQFVRGRADDRQSPIEMRAALGGRRADVVKRGVWCVREMPPMSSAVARRAASLCADSGSTRLPGRVSRSAPAGSVGASSRITCALVPPTPNELTPAQRGAPPGGHGVSAVGIASRVPSSEMCGLSVEKCTCGGIASCCSASTTLISPATPAAASRWPRLAFAEPSQHVRRAAAPDRGRDRFDLDRIAERRAGAVRLDEADALRLELRVGQRLANQRLLRRTVRRGEQRRVAVLIDGRAANHGQHAVAIGDRIGQPLEHDDAAALAAAEAVGARRRRSCSGRRGHEADLGHRDHAGRASSSATRHRPAATSLSPERRLWHARWMATSDDEQAVSIDRLGPAQIEKVRQAIGQHAVQRAGQRARVDRLEVAVLQLRVVVVIAGDEHAGAACRAAARAAARRRRAPRSRPRGTAAAADPCARPRAARCRSSRRRSRRSRARKPPYFVAVLPARRDRGRTSGRASQRSRGHLARRRRRHRAAAARTLRRVAAAGHAAGHADDGDRIGAQARLRLARAPAAPAAPA